VGVRVREDLSELIRAFSDTRGLAAAREEWPDTRGLAGASAHWAPNPRGCGDPSALHELPAESREAPRPVNTLHNVLSNLCVQLDCGGNVVELGDQTGQRERIIRPGANATAQPVLDTKVASCGCPSSAAALPTPEAAAFRAGLAATSGCCAKGPGLLFGSASGATRTLDQPFAAHALSLPQSLTAFDSVSVARAGRIGAGAPMVPADKVGVLSPTPGATSKLSMGKLMARPGISNVPVPGNQSVMQFSLPALSLRPVPSIGKNVYGRCITLTPELVPEYYQAIEQSFLASSTPCDAPPPPTVQGQGRIDPKLIVSGSSRTPQLEPDVWLRPGQVFQIRGGVYHGTLALHGGGLDAEGKPSIVENAPGETVILDYPAYQRKSRHGVNLYVCANDVWIRQNPEGGKFIIRNSQPQILEPPFPPVYRPDGAHSRPDGFVLQGKNVRITGLIILDVGNNNWNAGSSGIIEDCVILGTGFNATEKDADGNEVTQGHGHGIYVQSTVNDTKLIRRCAIGLGYAVGIHVYGGPHKARNVQVEDCVIWNAGSLAYARPVRLAVQIAEHSVKDSCSGVTVRGTTDGCSLRRCLVVNGYKYEPSFKVGYEVDTVHIGTSGAGPNISAAMEDCLMVGRLSLINRIHRLKMTGNTIIYGLQYPRPDKATVDNALAIQFIAENDPRTSPVENRTIVRRSTNLGNFELISTADLPYLFAYANDLPGRALLALTRPWIVDPKQQGLDVDAIWKKWGTVTRTEIDPSWRKVLRVALVDPEFGNVLPPY
jgi:hypothetical protein